MQLLVAGTEKRAYTAAMSSHRSRKASAFPPAQTPEPSPGRRRRLGGRSARVQAAVFAVTLELLQEQGYEALSVAAIAQRAGIHKTSLYRRWATKEQLVLEAVENQVTADFPRPDTGTLRADLIHLLRAFVEFLRSAVGQALLQMASVSSSAPSIGSFSKQYWLQRCYPYVQPIFDRAIARGEVAPQTDFHLLFELLLGVLIVRAVVLRESLEETLPERIVDLLLAGGGPILPKG
jgi:AcrR family transcriptional regulator